MGLQFTCEDAPDLTLPENKIFRAQLKEMKVHTFTWTDQRAQPPAEVESQILQWWWEVQSSDEFNGRKVKGESDVKLSNHPRNRFRGWAEVLLARDIPEGMVVDTDDLVGLTADITVKHRADKKDPSKKYEEVDDVMSVGGDGGTGWGNEPPF